MDEGSHSGKHMFSTSATITQNKVDIDTTGRHILCLSLAPSRLDNILLIMLYSNTLMQTNLYLFYMAVVLNNQVTL